MIKEEIKDLINKAVGKFGLAGKDVPAFVLEHPDEMSHGDFATNVALVLSKSLKKSPVEVAKQIVAEINQDLPVEISKVEIAGPGFINFYLSPKYFTAGVGEILNKGDKFGQINVLNNKRTVIEYTDPNPFKQFHIGHLMTNTIGESLSRLVEANGADVKKACYQGDVGLHVAMAIWGAQKMMNERPELKKQFFGTWFGFKKYPNQKLWGEAYALGATSNKENPQVAQEIALINKKVYSRDDTEINKLYDVGRSDSLRDFERIYKILDTKFDAYFFESKTGPYGKELVEEYLAKGVFEKSDGAVIFRGEKYGLHTRVFINKDGLPTYEAKELGLAKIKYDKFGYDQSVVVTGNEVSEYFKVLLAAMSQVWPELAKKTIHIGHGMFKLPTGKMSSRTGNVITADFLLSEIKNNVLEKMKDRQMSEREKMLTSEIISVGALKYSILKQQTGSDIIFDFDKAVSFEGDSGPYLQYSCVRAKSILEKAKKEGIKGQVSGASGQVAGELPKLLVRFGEIVERAGKEYSPHYLAIYLIQLAGVFSSFYAQETVVDKADVNSPYKVALTQAFSIVMQNGLKLLGIKVPNRM